MGILRFYRSKKYLQRIILTVSTLILLLVSGFAYTVYFYAQNIIVGIQKDANNKVLSQINYGIDYMNEVVRGIAVSLYFDNDVIPLMTASYPDQTDILTRRNKIDKFADYTPFIDSIIVYNGQMDQFIWGGNAELQNPNDDRFIQIRELMNGEAPFEKMKLFSLKPDVFSIANFDSASYEQGESVLFINVQTQWLFDNIRIINQLAGQMNENIVIIDDEGQFITPLDAAANPQADLADIIAQVPDQAASSGFVEYGSGNGKKMISYMTIKDNGWKVISIVPLESLMGKVERLKTISLSVTAVFLFVSILFALWISHRIYKPVSKLVNVVKPADASGWNPANKGDELAYLSDVYRRALEQASKAQKDQVSTHYIARQFYLRQLMNESQTMSTAQVQELITENDFNIAWDSDYLICILKMDNSGLMNEQHRKLVNFAISNIAQEIVSAKYLCETVEMKQDHLAMLISITDKAEAAGPAVAGHIRQVQDVVLKLYHVTFSAAVSDGFGSLAVLTRSYTETLQSLLYKFALGPGAVILPEMIRANQGQLGEHSSSFPVEWEKKLIEAIKLNQPDLFSRTLDRMFTQIAGMHYDYMGYMILHILLLMKIALRELNDNRIQPLSVDLSEANGKIAAAESLEESKRVFQDIFEEIADKQKNQDSNQRNAVLMEAIKEMIETKYTDVNLNLQEIAEAMRMSPTYIGKMFKKWHGQSVAEYINEIRLRNAVQYLEENKYNINDIIEKVGFGNRSIFFRLFKNKFGTTPKEYRISKSVMEP